MRAARIFAASVLLGCSATEGRDDAVDTGPLDTLVAETTRDARPPLETGIEVGTGEFGAPCVADECDPLGDGDRFCTSRDPQPFCATNRGCDTNAGACLGGLGLCMDEAGSLTCRPRCTFAAGVAALGCLPGDACVRVSDGEGYCFGGCVGVCKVGICQRETGLCTGKRIDYPRALGAPCTADEAGVCACTAGPLKAGYCTWACLTGAADGCPGGTVCRVPGLALEPLPSGLAGRCLRACTVELDCAGLSSTCQRGACLPS